MTLARLIGGFVRRHWRAYAASGAMLAAIALLGIWLPRQIGHMVDGLVARQLSGAAMWREIAWLLAAGAAIYGLRVAWRLQLFSTAFRLGVDLRVQLYRRLAQQGPRFYQTRRTGDLMALATNDVDAVELAAGEALLAGFDGTLTLLLVVAAMTLGVDWRLALVVLLPFPLMGLSFWWISRHLHIASRQALDAFGALNDQVQESISGVRTLRALGLTAQSAAQFGQLAGVASSRGLLAQRWEAGYEPAVGLTLNAAMALSLGFGGWLVWRGEMTVGQLTSFGLYLGQLIWPMFATGWVLALIERGRWWPTTSTAWPPRSAARPTWRVPRRWCSACRWRSASTGRRCNGPRTHAATRMAPTTRSGAPCSSAAPPMATASASASPT